MRWTGTWRNQYGSTLTIDNDADGRIEGTFVTAIDASSIAGETVSVVGVHRGELISISAAGGRAEGDIVMAFSGKMVGERLETVWQLVSSHKLSASAEGEKATRRPLEWPHAVMMNADTFERVG